VLEYGGPAGNYYERNEGKTSTSCHWFTDKRCVDPYYGKVIDKCRQDDTRIMNLSLEMPPARYRFIDLILCLPFLLIPLVLELPYRVNIFLSWEGAYRLYLGQMPFRDFGLPMGFGYWLIPTAFFHLLGPSMFSLVVAQVFINALSLVSLRGIFYNCGLKAYQVTLLLVVFCLTYVIYNFWPWYNHSVIVFELASLWMLTAFLSDTGRVRFLWLMLSAVMAFLSFFTKQDAGAICIVACLMVLFYHGFLTRKFGALATYSASLVIVAVLVITPFLSHGFLYWFNLGQPPHDSRVTVGKLLNVILGDSVWEKVYLAVITMGIIAAGTRLTEHFRNDWRSVVMLFISVVILGQAMITRATSPLPTDHMTYFHAFGIAGILCLLPLFNISARPRVAFAGLVVIALLFSAGYWRYVSGILHLAPSDPAASHASAPSAKWIGTKVEGFERVLMPEETVQGVERLLKDVSGSGRPLKVLNMSELTPLALSMNYTPPTNQPLWYHLNIGIFDKEIDEFCRRVGNQEYDVVLFEDIPDLTHFYPYRVRDALRDHYVLKDSFMAPRKLENSTIEVYVRPDGIRHAKK
jgi:hypothetical protein